MRSVKSREEGGKMNEKMPVRWKQEEKPMRVMDGRWEDAGRRCCAGEESVKKEEGSRGSQERRKREDDAQKRWDGIGSCTTPTEGGLSTTRSYNGYSCVSALDIIAQ